MFWIVPLTKLQKSLLYACVQLSRAQTPAASLWKLQKQFMPEIWDDRANWRFEMKECSNLDSLDRFEYENEVWNIIWTLKFGGSKIFSGSPNCCRKRWFRAIQFLDPGFLRSQRRIGQLTTIPNESICTTQKLMRWRTGNDMWMRSCVLGSVFMGVQKVGLIPGCTLNRNKTYIESVGISGLD